jgi:hypothetical protein
MQRIYSPPFSYKAVPMALSDVENEAILEELIKTLPAMDPAIAGAILLEAKGILDELGVTSQRQ